MGSFPARVPLSGQRHPQLSQVRRGRHHAHHKATAAFGLHYCFLQPESQSQRQRQGVCRPRADHTSTRLRVLVSTRRPVRSPTRVFHNRCVRTLCRSSQNATSTSTQNQTRHAERSRWTAKISRLLLQHPSSSLGRPRLAHAVAPHTPQAGSDTRDPWEPQG
jgi:hypothetical protein